ncbi:MAG: 50S ribosomal protein L9 [Planctomycetota bacterium]
MELILLESVDGLGRPGDQVKVRPGYARNFLMPRGKAVPVSADVLRSLDKLKAKADAEERALLSSMEELAKAIDGAEVQISARATDEGHLFGSVTEKDIHAALVAAGWQVNLRAVRLPMHLKEAGVAPVELHLHGAITATVQVDVIPIDAEGNPIESPEAEQGIAEGEGAAVEASDEAPAGEGAATPESDAS